LEKILFFLSYQFIRELKDWVKRSKGNCTESQTQLIWLCLMYLCIQTFPFHCIHLMLYFCKCYFSNNFCSSTKVFTRCKIQFVKMNREHKEDYYWDIFLLKRFCFSRCFLCCLSLTSIAFWKLFFCFSFSS